MTIIATIRSCIQRSRRRIMGKLCGSLGFHLIVFPWWGAYFNAPADTDFASRWHFGCLCGAMRCTRFDDKAAASFKDLCHGKGKKSREIDRLTRVIEQLTQEKAALQAILARLDPVDRVILGDRTTLTDANAQSAYGEARRASSTQSLSLSPQ